MEIEPSAPRIAAKKLWNIVRIVMYMLRKGMSKSKLILDIQKIAFQDMLKRGKIASKTLTNLMLHPPAYSASSFTCKSHNDVAMSFITRREYEFSCSNSPVFPTYNKRSRRNHHRTTTTYKSHEIAVVQKVFEILNTTTSTTYDAYGTTTNASSPTLALPGFGKSPNNVRKLRVTDSPFPLEENYNSQVDKDAEEFIKKFYKDLKQQKKIASLESPSPYQSFSPVY